MGYSAVAIELLRKRHLPRPCPGFKLSGENLWCGPKKVFCSVSFDGRRQLDTSGWIWSM